ncbi:MAG: hypothetical protein AAGD32_03470 [Planctomycetota bacterium]
MPTKDDYQALRRDPAAKAEQQRQWHAARRRERRVFVLLVTAGVVIVALIGVTMLYAAMQMNRNG